jgi:hypothetical protein
MDQIHVITEIGPVSETLFEETQKMDNVRDHFHN